MVEAGYADGNLLVPTVFLVIVVTVVVDSITLGPLARRLKLTVGARNGLLIVGSSPWSAEFAAKLQGWGVNVTLADSNYDRLQPARMAGVPTYFGEVLSEDAEDEADVSRLNYMLAATDNDYYNALVARSLGADFEYHRTFQLATAGESTAVGRRMAFARRGSFAFDGHTNLSTLEEMHAKGWAFHSVVLRPEFDRDALVSHLGNECTRCPAHRGDRCAGAIPRALAGPAVAAGQWLAGDLLCARERAGERQGEASARGVGQLAEVSRAIAAMKASMSPSEVSKLHIQRTSFFAASQS